MDINLLQQLFDEGLIEEKDFLSEQRRLARENRKPIELPRSELKRELEKRAVVNHALTKEDLAKRLDLVHEKETRMPRMKAIIDVSMEKIATMKNTTSCESEIRKVKQSYEKAYHAARTTNM